MHITSIVYIVPHLIIHACDIHREVGASNAKAQIAGKTGSHGHGATAT